MKSKLTLADIKRFAEKPFALCGDVCALECQKAGIFCNTFETIAKMTQGEGNHYGRFSKQIQGLIMNMNDDSDTLIIMDDQCFMNTITDIHLNMGDRGFPREHYHELLTGIINNFHGNVYILKQSHPITRSHQRFNTLSTNPFRVNDVGYMRGVMAEWGEDDVMMEGRQRTQYPYIANERAAAVSDARNIFGDNRLPVVDGPTRAQMMEAAMNARHRAGMPATRLTVQEAVRQHLIEDDAEDQVNPAIERLRQASIAMGMTNPDEGEVFRT